MSRLPARRVLAALVASGALAAGCAAPPRAVSASAVPTLVVVEQGANRLALFDGCTGARRATVPLGLKPHEIALSADGRTAYVSNFGIEDYDHALGVPGARVSVVDLERGVETRRFWTHQLAPGDSSALAEGASWSRAPHGLALRPGHPHELAVNVEVGDSLLTFDTRTGRRVRGLPVPPGTHHLEFSPDGRRVHLFTGEAGVVTLDAETGRELARRRLPTPTRGLTATADGRFLIASGRGELTVLDPADLSVVRTIGGLGVGQIIYTAATPDGRFLLAPSPSDHVVVVVDLATGAVVRRLDTGLKPASVLVSPDGRSAFVSNVADTTLARVDLTTWAVTPFARVVGSNRMAWTPVGARPCVGS